MATLWPQPAGVRSLLAPAERRRLVPTWLPEPGAFGGGTQPLLGRSAPFFSLLDLLGAPGAFGTPLARRASPRSALQALTEMGAFGRGFQRRAPGEPPREPLTKARQAPAARPPPPPDLSMPRLLAALPSLLGPFLRSFLGPLMSAPSVPAAGAPQTAAASQASAPSPTSVATTSMPTQPSGSEAAAVSPRAGAVPSFGSLAEVILGSPAGVNLLRSVLSAQAPEGRLGPALTPEAIAAWKARQDVAAASA